MLASSFTETDVYKEFIHVGVRHAKKEQSQEVFKGHKLA